MKTATQQHRCGLCRLMWCLRKPAQLVQQQNHLRQSGGPEATMAGGPEAKMAGGPEGKMAGGPEAKMVGLNWNKPGRAGRGVYDHLSFLTVTIVLLLRKGIVLHLVYSSVIVVAASRNITAGLWNLTVSMWIIWALKAIRLVSWKLVTGQAQLMQHGGAPTAINAPVNP